MLWRRAVSSPLVLGATELTGGASVPPAPPPLPTAAAGTVRGVWLALGPVLFLTGTLRRLFVTLRTVQNGTVELTTRPKLLTSLSPSFLPSHPSFKREVAAEQKNLEEEGKARHPHDHLPCGKQMWTPDPPITTDVHAFSRLLAGGHLCFLFQRHLNILFLNVNAAACPQDKFSSVPLHTQAWNEDRTVRFRFSSLFNTRQRSPSLNTDNHPGNIKRNLKCTHSLFTR